MNLIIFTPGVRASAIGRMTRLVVRELVRMGHGVTVVRSEIEPLLADPAHDFGVATLPWTAHAQVSALVHSADMVVYQIGNHYPYHAVALQWLGAVPGVVCMHDNFLGHLFGAWCHYRQQDPQAVVAAWYGAAIAERYPPEAGSSDLAQSTHDSAPMVEWVASMALGVLTHADWGVPRLLRSCPGPVYTVPLAYDVTAVDAADLSDQDGRFRVVTAGQINLNKRPESIIQAIGGDAQLRDRLHYRLVGGIEPGVATRLTELAAGLGVRLTILGEVSDETFSQELAGADLVCCLRYPALESASATAIEAMLSGKAVLVTDVGSYRDLPDDCVRKISQDDELAQLRDALKFFLAHPHERALWGQRARTFAQATFSASRYAERLVELAEAVTRTAPLDAAMRFFAQALAGWGAGEALPTQDILGPLAIFGSSPDGAGRRPN